MFDVMYMFRIAGGRIVELWESAADGDITRKMEAAAKKCGSEAPPGA